MGEAMVTYRTRSGHLLEVPAGGSRERLLIKQGCQRVDTEPADAPDAPAAVDADADDVLEGMDPVLELRVPEVLTRLSDAGMETIERLIREESQHRDRKSVLEGLERLKAKRAERTAAEQDDRDDG